MALGGEVGEEGGDLGRAHLVGVAGPPVGVGVEAAEAAGPGAVGLLGTDGVVADSAGVAEPVEEARCVRSLPGSLPESLLGFPVRLLLGLWHHGGRGMLCGMVPLSLSTGVMYLQGKAGLK